MADNSVFYNIKTKMDYDRAEEEFNLKKQLAARQAMGQDPASVKLANEIQKARASGDLQRLNDLQMSAKLLDRGVVYDQMGNPMPMGGYGDAVGSIEGAKAGYKQNAQNASDLSYKPIIARDTAQQEANVKLATQPGIEAAVDLAEAGAERAINQPREKQRVDAVKRQAQSIQDEITRAGNKIEGMGTSGWIGGVTQDIPGTPSFGLKKTLETIKGNLGFAELQAMRDASPTGGALGQVAVQELTALQSTIANLDMGQSDEDLAYALKKIQGHIANWKNAVEQSYAEKYPQGAVSDEQFNDMSQNIRPLTMDSLGELSEDPMAASRNAIMERNAEGIQNPNQTLPQPQGQPPAPKKGQLVNGYMFMGGSPADKKNWKKVK